MKKIKWLPINGTNGKYLISNQGQVKNTKFDSLLKPSTRNLKGYERVSIRIDGKYERPYIHRLVGEHFISNPEDKCCINHKDGNKLNNSISNLHWCTASENMQHAYRIGLMNHKSRLSCETVKEILSMRQVGKSLLKIADQFSIEGARVWDIVNGNSYRKCSC